MSRSFKKPYLTDQQKGKTTKVKRAAARATRVKNKKACKELENEELADGTAYKRAYNSWNIRDYTFYYPKDKKSYRK